MRSGGCEAASLISATVSSPGRPKEEKPSAKGTRAADKPKVKACARQHCKRPGVEKVRHLKGLVCKEEAEYYRAAENFTRCFRRVKAFEDEFDEAVEAGDEYLQGRWLRLLRRAEHHWIAAEGRELRSARILNGEPPEGKMRLDTPEARRIAKKTRSKPRRTAPRDGKSAKDSIPFSAQLSPSPSPAPRPPEAVESPEDAPPARPPARAEKAPRKPAGDRHWFKVSEVADRLAVQPKTVYEWIRAGELEATKFGPQSTRVRASELARFEREGIEG